MSTTEVAALTQQPASELARMIAGGEVSAVEVVEAHIARIEQVNPALNAVAVKRYEAALTEARAADERKARGETLGALHGVPVTIKEALDVAGTPSTFGLPSRAGMLAERDDPYVARLKAAGAIVLGKTNVSQMLFYNEADNPVYGRTNNPWNPERTAGGSSGGEGAILAAGGSALGLGNDWGGSVRTPAAFCGLASIKPTSGRVPDVGRYSLPVGQQAIVCQVGVMARRVDDVVAGLEIINGGRNPAAEPPRPLGHQGDVDVAKLRVAYYSDDGTFPVSPAVRRAVIEAAGMLAGRGAHVVEWRPPDARQGLDLFYSLLASDGARAYKQVIGRDKRDPRLASLLALGGASPALLAGLRLMLRLSGQRNTLAILRNFGHRDTAHYWKLVEARMEYAERFRAALDGDDGEPFDVIVCPACSVPAFQHGASRDLSTAGAYAPLYNLLGYPAGVVPVTRVRSGEDTSRKSSVDAMERTARKADIGSVGLPIGVQVVARPWREHVALAAMRAIEEAAIVQGEHPGMPPL